MKKIILTILMMGACHSYACVTINESSNLVDLNRDGSNWVCSTSREVYTPTVIMPMNQEVASEITSFKNRFDGHVRCVLDSSSLMNLPLESKSNVPGVKVSSSIKLVQVFKISGCIQGN
jgi:hypothetical protein